MWFLQNTSRFGPTAIISDWSLKISWAIACYRTYKRCHSPKAHLGKVVLAETGGWLQVWGQLELHSKTQTITAKFRVICFQISELENPPLQSDGKISTESQLVWACVAQGSPVWQSLWLHLQDSAKHSLFLPAILHIIPLKLVCLFTQRKTSGFLLPKGWVDYSNSLDWKLGEKEELAKLDSCRFLFFCPPC